MRPEESRGSSTGCGPRSSPGFEMVCEVSGEGRLEGRLPFGSRMEQMDSVCVERMSRELQPVPVFVREVSFDEVDEKLFIFSIDLVTYNWVPYRGEVGSDLMLPARAREGEDEAAVREPFEDVELGTSLHADLIVAWSHADTYFRVQGRPQGHVDHLSLELGGTLDDGEVFLAYEAFLELDFDVSLRLPRACTDHDSTRLAVESMGDDRSVLAVALAQQPGECVPMKPGRWMHGQARWFVYDEEVVVFMENTECPWSWRLHLLGAVKEDGFTIAHLT